MAAQPNSTGLTATIRDLLRAKLGELVPLWLSEPKLDPKRVVRPTGDSGTSTSVESYRGSRTASVWTKKSEVIGRLQQLESAIKQEHPYLLGPITLPGRRQPVGDIATLVTHWCRICESQISRSASLNEAIAYVIDALDNVLSSRRVDLDNFIILTGLTMPQDGSPISLEPNLCLRRLTATEISEFASHDVYSVGVPMWPFTTFSCALVLTTTADCFFSDSHNATSDRLPDPINTNDPLHRALGALHVLKKGSVGVLKMIQIVRQDIFPYLSGLTSIPFSINPTTSMNIEGQEVALLLTYYSAIKNDSRESVRLSVRRLTDAENRTSRIDALLDAVIGLEALLLPGSTAELSFRAALNFAFLGPVAERAERNRRLKKVLELRGKVVHGVPPSDPHALAAQADIAKECLRDTIQRVLTDPTLGPSRHLDSKFWLDRVLNSQP